MKKCIVFMIIAFFLQGCIAKNQDMYAEDALSDRHEREKSVDHALKTYIAPVVAIPGALVVGTIQGVGEVATYAAENPELMQQGIKTYQQLEHEQRVDQQRAERAYSDLMKSTNSRTSYTKNNRSSTISTGYNSEGLNYKYTNNTSQSDRNGYNATSSSHSVSTKATTNQPSRASTYGQQNNIANSYSSSNNDTNKNQAKEKPYKYEFIEGMAFIIRHEKTKFSGVRYSGKGPAGSITSYETEEQAIATAGCKNYQGVGHSHTYGEYNGKVYYCNRPLRPGFFSTDIDGDYGVGPGLTSGRKRWLCKDKALGGNWRERCKEI